MARNKYLRRGGFRDYLKASGDSLAFVTRDSNLCPVATYLSDQTRREWNVSPLACLPQVDTEVEGHEFRPPRWARDFIHALDSYFGTKPKRITGNEALYVLDEAVR